MSYYYTGVVHFRSEALEYIVIPELSTSGRRLWSILLYRSCPLQVGGSGIYYYTGGGDHGDKKYHATSCRLQLLSYYVFTHVFSHQWSHVATSPLSFDHQWLPLPLPCVLGYICVYPSFLILSPVVIYSYPSTVFLSPMITSGYPYPVFLSPMVMCLPLLCDPLFCGHCGLSLQ